jgi:preprotein translocase subunit SecE
MEILSRPISFLEEVKQELVKVTWPSKNQTINMTLIVLAVSVLVGVFVGGLDYVFTKVMEVALKR